jgi:hypothetical protein
MIGSRPCKEDFTFAVVMVRLINLLLGKAGEDSRLGKGLASASVISKVRQSVKRL